MKQLTCEMCGSHDLMKKNGVFVCQTCGCQYSPEEAKKMLEVTGTVSINRSREFDNLLRMANNAYKSEHYGDTIKYINRIHEIDMNNAEAWRLKALGVCGMFREEFTEGMNYYDMVLSWQNALMTVDTEEKTDMEEKIFKDFVTEFLVHFMIYQKVFREQAAAVGKPIMDRLLLLFKGLSEVFRTPELEYFKRKIPGYNDHYVDGLVEYYACVAFNVVKSVTAGYNAYTNIDRERENKIWEEKFSQNHGLYLLKNLLDVAESNDTKAYIYELLAFSSLYYQFDIDEYQVLEELDSNQTCKMYFAAMLQHSEKYQKKYENVAKEMKTRREEEAAMIADVDKTIELIQQYNAQMEQNIKTTMEKVQESENSFFGSLNATQTEELRHKKNVLKKSIHKNQEIMKALKKERDAMGESMHKFKAVTRAKLGEIEKFIPEAKKLSRTIANL